MNAPGRDVGVRRRAAPALAVVLAAAACGGCATGLPPGAFDAGPLACRDTTLDGAARLRVLGPVYERQTAPDGRQFTALRPLYSRLADPASDKEIRELAWPLAVRKTIGREMFWRFALAYQNDFDRHDPDSRFRFVAFPFLYCGRNGAGEPYFGVFPFGGRVDEYLMVDRFDFVLFPLYGRICTDDHDSRMFLWPLVSFTRGGGVSRFGIFPFYGRSVNGTTWRKQYVLWPFWTSVRYNYPKSKGGGFILFPLYGHIRTNDQEMRMLLPPLFQWGRGRDGRETKVNAPYPFVQYRRGAVSKTYLFPFWGRKTTDQSRNTFVLWPLIERHETDRAGYRAIRRRVVPFVYWETRLDLPARTAQAGRARSQYLRVWPLFCRSREDDRVAWTAPDLNPLTNYGGIQRNWMPFWTLYRYETRGDARECDVLWGMVRRRRDADGTRSLSVFPFWSHVRTDGPAPAEEWRVLGGLLGARREQDLPRTWRVLYFARFGGPPAGATADGTRPSRAP